MNTVRDYSIEVYCARCDIVFPVICSNCPKCNRVKAQCRTHSYVSRVENRKRRIRIKPTRLETLRSYALQSEAFRLHRKELPLKQAWNIVKTNNSINISEKNYLKWCMA